MSKVSEAMRTTPRKQIQERYIAILHPCASIRHLHQTDCGLSSLPLYSGKKGIRSPLGEVLSPQSHSSKEKERQQSTWVSGSTGACETAWAGGREKDFHGNRFQTENKMHINGVSGKVWAEARETRDLNASKQSLVRWRCRIRPTSFEWRLLLFANYLPSVRLRFIFGLSSRSNEHTPPSSVLEPVSSGPHWSLVSDRVQLVGLADWQVIGRRG